MRTALPTRVGWIRIGLWMIAALAFSFAPRLARAQNDAPHARVTATTTALRSGPGAGYRVVGVAERGQVFPVLERATTGYWLELRLPDSTRAWISGDAVYVFEAGDDGQRRPWVDKVFAPPPLPQAHGEVAMVFGALGSSGFMALRPSYLVAPSFGLELNLGASVSSAGRTFLGGLGGVVNLFPHLPVVPFATVGGGYAYATPNSDSFVLQDGSSSMVYAGGGLRMGFKYRLTLRVEARGVVFFAADRYVAEQEVSGGLTVFF